jgi:predicted nucleic acid-binding protein
MSDEQPVLVLVRDLMFSSRITAEARAQQVAVKVIRDPLRLSYEAGTRLIIDLNQDGAIEAAMAWKKQHGGAVVGFVSHVDTETIAKAQESGIDQIVSRGQLAATLGEILRG